MFMVRVIIDDLTFNWKEVSSGAPLGYILGLVFFNIFVNYLDYRSEYTCSKFEDDPNCMR